ncbi:MAG: hypothetical protein LBU94_04895, partial [Clostridiales bacterium]|nr:hypothetical protein [Clostridiales bacterium]
MQNRVRETIENLKERWDDLERQQKIRLVLGVTVLLISLGVALYFTFRTEWSKILENRDVVTLTEAIRALEEAEIPVRMMDNDSSIAVPETYRFDALSIIESNPEIEGEASFDSQAAFDQMGVGVSESVKREMMTVSKQNEIANSIKEMFAVNDATVFLNIPERSIVSFTEAEPATASIFINQSTDIDSSKAEAIAEHVATAVEGLKRENITITNQYMEILYSGNDQGNGVLTNDYEMELKRKAEIEMRAYNLLKPVYDDVKIMSNIVVNTDQVTQESYQAIPVGDDINTGVTSERTEMNENATSEG